MPRWGDIADTTEHVDLHPGSVDLVGRPSPHTLSGRPSPYDRPFGGIEPRYRWSDDADGTHRGAAQPPAAVGFNIDIRVLEATILARTGDPTGTIAFATDTHDLYVYDGAAWQIYNDT